MNIYGVYDKKAESFDFIFTEDNDNTAVRPVYSLLQRGDSKYLSFPDDFAVYKLASFDLRKGDIYPNDMKNIVFELRSLFNTNCVSDDIGSVRDLDSDSVNGSEVAFDEF